MKKLSVRLERCTGCKRCEIGCMEAHPASEPQFKPATRIFVEPAGWERAAPVVCRHCREAFCVSACMTGCMQKDPVTGLVTNMGHEQKCVGCWMCIMACPFGVITPGPEPTNPSAFAVALKCDFCPDRDTPACVEACPNQAIEVLEVPPDNLPPRRKAQ